MRCPRCDYNLHEIELYNSLVNREKLVLLMLVKHTTIDRISSELKMTEGHCRVTLCRIYKKFGVSNKKQLIDFVLYQPVLVALLEGKA